MRVLLFEDDRMIGEAVSVALKDAAYAVDWVQDGATANSALENGEHQAVLLDLGLTVRIVRRELSPVLRLAQTLDEQCAERPQSLSNEDVPDEIAPFVRAPSLCGQGSTGHGD